MGAQTAVVGLVLKASFHSKQSPLLSPLDAPVIQQLKRTFKYFQDYRQVGEWHHCPQLNAMLFRAYRTYRKSLLFPSESAQTPYQESCVCACF